MQRYNPKEIEPKWQAKWAEDKIYEASEDQTKPKRYVAEYFPYPSGAAMHVGHVRNYTIGDVISRHARMQGYNVLHPMGWDAFGLPAENYAIKTGISPQQAIAENTGKFKQQLTSMGFSYDWSREFASSDPSYYKWTQWFFLVLYKRGLAYNQEALQWWCPNDKTVLANEQVENGRCWRCGFEVEKKALRQWFFKITDYADRLEADLDGLDWSESIKSMQRNWIGHSTGAEITFKLETEEKTTDVTLKFRPELADMVLSGQKYVSYRFDDEKKLAVGSVIGLVNAKTLDTVARVRILKADERVLSEIPLKFPGHEDFASLNERRETYAGYYGREISDDDLVSIYTFEIIDDAITVFTTRADTLYGATFLVIAPEHPLLQTIVPETHKQQVSNYQQKARNKSEIERQETNREKTGVFTGAYAVNPINGRKLPVWTADYVLMGYGTGAIMAVPAHDDRDYAFAQKFDLPVTFVVEPTFGEAQGDDVQSEKVYVVLRNPANDTVVVLNWGPRQKNYGGTMLIGGTVEPGEAHQAAAEREIHEETGYQNFKLVKEAEFKGHGYFYSNVKDLNVHASGKALLYDLIDETRDGGNLDAGEKDKFSVTWQPAGKVAAMLDDGVHEAMYRYLVLNECYHGDGILINSGPYDGLPTAEGRKKIIADLAAKHAGQQKVNYRMRDWLISRQRYWGAPIPMIHCPKDGIVPVPEDQLPVVLPELTKFEPSGDGRSPLANVPEFLHTTCPECGGPAQRETDTMDGFACSSWYLLRFADPHNADRPFDADKVKFWLPVDDYIGGAEHAVMHLLYARMWTKVMQDEGLIDFGEPFKALRNQGMILAPDGQKMSKSKGNTIQPDELIEQGYGADSIRIMELFIGPWNQSASWSVEGMGGSYRFLQRVWTLVHELTEKGGSDTVDETARRELKVATHKTIQKVSTDLSNMSFNTAIAAMMECVNSFYELKHKRLPFVVADTAWYPALITLVQLLAPFAPHIAEELWHELRQDGSVHLSSWPEYDKQYLVEDTVTIAVQVNGKLRGIITAPAGCDEAAASELAHAEPKIAANLTDKQIVKRIYVPGKLLNYVVK